MFDTCRACRKRLALRSEGRLPRSQWARLEHHLSHCRSCKRVDEADRSLHLALSRSHYTHFSMTRDRSEAFDDRVMNMVLNQRQTLWSRLLETFQDRWLILKQYIADSMASQVAAGAVLAAAGAACFLAVATHPGALKYAHGSEIRHASALRWLNGPPVPVESLAGNQSPRQAILWSTPSDSSRSSVAARTDESVKQPAKYPTEQRARGKF